MCAGVSAHCSCRSWWLCQSPGCSKHREVMDPATVTMCEAVTVDRPVPSLSYLPTGKYPSCSQWCERGGGKTGWINLSPLYHTIFPQGRVVHLNNKNWQWQNLYLALICITKSFGRILVGHSPENCQYKTGEPDRRRCHSQLLVHHCCTEGGWWSWRPSEPPHLRLSRVPALVHCSTRHRLSSNLAEKQVWDVHLFHKRN